MRLVIPREGKANILGAGPVCRDGVQFLEDCQQMLGMFSAHIFDDEVVDDKAACDGSSGMLEEARGVRALVISVRFEMLDKSGIRNDGRPYIPLRTTTMT